MAAGGEAERTSRFGDRLLISARCQAGGSRVRAMLSGAGSLAGDMILGPGLSSWGLPAPEAIVS